MKKTRLAEKGPGEKKGTTRKSVPRKGAERGSKSEVRGDEEFSFSRALLSLRNLIWQGKYEELEKVREEYLEKGLQFLFIRENMQLHYQYEENGEKIIKVEYLGKRDELGGVFG